MPLYMLTVPGLEVRFDWAAVHDRLLDDFPQITDVVATTMASTLLIVHQGGADIDGWIDGVSEVILNRRLRLSRQGRRQGRTMTPTG